MITLFYIYEKKAEFPHKSDGFYAKTPQRRVDYLKFIITSVTSSPSPSSL